MRPGLWVAALGLAVSACATHPPPLAGGLYSGRLAVRSEALDGRPANSMSGQFELSGSASDGQLVLTSPIGTTIARARWSHPEGPQGEPRDIELEAAGGTTRFDSLDAMMERALGDQVPLSAMFDWLAGQPWPAAPASRWPAGSGFDQLGWHIDLTRYASDRLISADRSDPAPALHVRVKLDAAAPAASAAP